MTALDGWLAESTCNMVCKKIINDSSQPEHIEAAQAGGNNTLEKYAKIESAGILEVILLVCVCYSFPAE